MVTVTYLGHSAVQLDYGPSTILIDPFLRGNPKARITPDALTPQYIIVTHGHSDHLGDAIEIALRCGSQVIATYELAVWLGSKGVNVHPMGVGGSHKFPFGHLKFTIAHHSAGLGEMGDTYAGVAAGVVFEFGGKVFYHAGDTALTYDMKLIPEWRKVDLAFLPIGDNFTMGVDDAVTALTFVRPRLVVPIHYNTFDMIAADAGAFARKANATGHTTAHVLEPMGTLTI